MESTATAGHCWQARAKRRSCRGLSALRLAVCLGGSASDSLCRRACASTSSSGTGRPAKPPSTACRTPERRGNLRMPHARKTRKSPPRRRRRVADLSCTGGGRRRRTRRRGRRRRPSVSAPPTTATTPAPLQPRGALLQASTTSRSQATTPALLAEARREFGRGPGGLGGVALVCETVPVLVIEFKMLLVSPGGKV